MSVQLVNACIKRTGGVSSGYSLTLCGVGDMNLAGGQHYSLLLKAGHIFFTDTASGLSQSVMTSN